jgi:hypothetical protein
LHQSAVRGDSHIRRASLGLDGPGARPHTSTELSVGGPGIGLNGAVPAQ